MWKEALDNGLKVGVLFIDFRKAFDCVDHVILGEKLKALGVSEDMWIWLMDYLANRTQLTQIDGIFSESKPVKIGVPQGSLLGPRLFITYVNDLPDSIRSGEGYMYADDTTIYTIGNTIDEVAIALQEISQFLDFYSQKDRYLLRHFNTKSLKKKYARTNVLKNSYFYRIVDEWNSLPLEVRSACNVDKFKASVIKFVTKL